MGCGCNSNFVGKKPAPMPSVIVEEDNKEKNNKTKIKKRTIKRC